MKTLKSNKGVGLLVTLLVLSTLASFATMAFRKAREHLFYAGNYAKHIQALTLAKAGVNLARAGLLLDKNKKDDLEEDWHTLSSMTQLAPLPLGNGFLSINISDEESKPNINSMNEKQLTAYFKSLSLKRVRKGDLLGMDIIDDGLERELAHAFLDWTDYDDEEREEGAESPWYRKDEKKLLVHNQKLATVGEMLWIKGFTKEMLFGKKGNPRLIDLFTIYGSGKINLNTVTHEVLEVFIRQENEYQAESLAELVLQDRPFETDGEAKSAIARAGLSAELQKMVKVKSEYFKIIATGIVGDYKSEIEAIVKRSNESCDILLWKEREFEEKTQKTQEESERGDYE
ncbi:MAG: general secretion pathway protein GspK [Candidatus Cloacimonetes bacterium]|nr:general secretion pathway protein GspK [Candidatus Cloacimonadota bacterium]